MYLADCSTSVNYCLQSEEAWHITNSFCPLLWIMLIHSMDGKQSISQTSWCQNDWLSSLPSLGRRHHFLLAHYWRELGLSTKDQSRCKTTSQAKNCPEEPSTFLSKFYHTTSRFSYIVLTGCDMQIVLGLEHFTQVQDLRQDVWDIACDLLRIQFFSFSFFFPCVVVCTVT